MGTTAWSASPDRTAWSATVTVEQARNLAPTTAGTDRSACSVKVPAGPR